MLHAEDGNANCEAARITHGMRSAWYNHLEVNWQTGKATSQMMTLGSREPGAAYTRRDVEETER